MCIIYRKNQNYQHNLDRFTKVIQTTGVTQLFEWHCFTNATVKRAKENQSCVSTIKSAVLKPGG